jgi:Ca2+-binding EF-hand superfamily protein
MPRIRYSLPCLALGLVLTAAAPAAPPDRPPGELALPPLIEAVRHVEVVEMLEAILSGSQLQGGNSAWFHPSQSTYDLQWLLGRCDADHDGAISRKEFPGSPALFDRLDRNHDGRLTRADFDWSDEAPLNREYRIVYSLFRRADRDRDGKISAKEWQDLFEQASKGKDGLSREDLHALLFPPPPPPPSPKEMASYRPTTLTLLRGVLTGELGSPFEGPSVGAVAPDFTLYTHDGAKIVSLSQFRGKKPVVLVFGSFT